MSASGLQISLVDTADAHVFEPWVRSKTRGFHEPSPVGAAMASQCASKRDRRVTGVWERGASPTDEPVGTVSSWAVDITVSPNRAVAAWAISSVTVAATHRRRGIARALLDAELATASSLGLAIAAITVSESTIYGRFGFAAAADVSHLSIETHRAAMYGSVAEGRTCFVSLDQAREMLPYLHDLSRVQIPGQIDVGAGLWDELSGRDGKHPDKAESLRAVQYEDVEGDIQGIVIYRVTGGDQDFTKHVLQVEYFLSITPDAYSSLWRFLLSVDLVSQVKAPLRSVDEPLRWQLVDQRALTETREDHLWVRILDVAAALEARNYSADGQIGFDVSDDQGYTSGRYVLAVTDRAGVVSRVDRQYADGTPVLTLSVNELSALYLGGVPARTLERAGRVIGSTPEATLLADAMLRSSITPWLDVWF